MKNIIAKALVLSVFLVNSFACKAMLEEDAKSIERNLKSLELEVEYGTDVDLIKTKLDSNLSSFKTSSKRGEIFGYACWNGTEELNIKKLKIFLDRCSELINIKGRGGWTVLMGATYLAHLDTIRFLLQQPGIDLSIKNDNGDTAMDMAHKKKIVERHSYKQPQVIALLQLRVPRH